MKFFSFIYGFLSLVFGYQLVSILTLDRNYDFGSISPFIATSFVIVPVFTALLLIQGFYKKLFWLVIPSLIAFAFIVGTLSPYYWIQSVVGLVGYLLLSLILGYFSWKSVKSTNNVPK
jgi:hypothetical protein